MKLCVWLMVMLSTLAAYANPLDNNGADYDSKQPVEITADTLEVVQQDQVAVFSGDVEAVQGELTITSSTMTVYYDRNANEASKENSASNNSVSKVIAQDNVFLTNRRETAQGNKAVYHVDKAEISLTGDVVLTSGKNIVKGEELVYNIKTGTSTMVSAVEQGAQGSGRVRGVFVPQN